MISAIVCVDENWGIGSNGNLLIKIPEDMSFFKEKTNNSTVIMGRKTYDSLPKKPLPDRENVVITSKFQDKFNFIRDENETVFTGLNNVKDVFESMKRLKEDECNDVFVIGGGQIYKELLPYCECVYITKVFHCYDDVDTYFPNIDGMQEWELKSASEIKEYKRIEYQFCEYRKKA